MVGESVVTMVVDTTVRLVLLILELHHQLQTRVRVEEGDVGEAVLPPCSLEHEIRNALVTKDHVVVGRTGLGELEVRVRGRRAEVVSPQWRSRAERSGAEQSHAELQGTTYHARDARVVVAVRRVPGVRRLVAVVGVEVHESVVAVASGLSDVDVSRLRALVVCGQRCLTEVGDKQGQCGA